MNTDGTIDKRIIKKATNKTKEGSYNNPYFKNGDLITLSKIIFNISIEVASLLTSVYYAFGLIDIVI